MSVRAARLAIGLALVANASHAVSPPDLLSEMSRLRVPSILIVASQAVDEHPIWSPDGDAIAANVDGAWVRVDLKSISLVAGTWRGNSPIGIPNPALKRVRIAPSTVKAWRKKERYGPRRVQLPDRTTVELRLDDLSTELVVTKPAGQPEVAWRSGMENCHGLSVSPDGKLVAYVCELNGVIVTAPE